MNGVNLEFLGEGQTGKNKEEKQNETKVKTNVKFQRLLNKLTEPSPLRIPSDIYGTRACPCLGFPSRSNSFAFEPKSALSAPYSRYPDSLSLRPYGNPLSLRARELLR